MQKGWLNIVKKKSFSQGVGFEPTQSFESMSTWLWESKSHALDHSANLAHVGYA